jgi:hypothetical protein
MRREGVNAVTSARWLFIVIAATVIAHLGCGGSKADRLPEARAALARADSGGAAIYAPELYQEASDLLARAEDAWRLGHRGESRDLAGDCMRLSRRAIREAEENQAKAREAAEASMHRLEEAVARARDAVSNMMLGVTPPEMAQARADLDRVEEMLRSVRKAFQHGLYFDAREMAETAEGEAVSIEEGAKVAANIGGRDPSSL